MSHNNRATSRKWSPSRLENVHRTAGNLTIHTPQKTLQHFNRHSLRAEGNVTKLTGKRADGKRTDLDEWFDPVEWTDVSANESPIEYFDIGEQDVLHHQPNKEIELTNLCHKLKCDRDHTLKDCFRQRQHTPAGRSLSLDEEITIETLGKHICQQKGTRKKSEKGVFSKRHIIPMVALASLFGNLTGAAHYRVNLEQKRNELIDSIEQRRDKIINLEMKNLKQAKQRELDRAAQLDAEKHNYKSHFLSSSRPVMSAEDAYTKAQNAVEEIKHRLTDAEQTAKRQLAEVKRMDLREVEKTLLATHRKK